MGDVATFVTEDPAVAQRAAGEFLMSDPVRHSVLLDLLRQRLEKPMPGRYWWSADADGRVQAYAMQSPLTFFAALAPAARPGVEALADRMAADVPLLPGVMGEAATATAFAARWAERLGVPARPVETDLVYRLDSVVPPAAVPGRLRKATVADREILVPWAAAFCRIAQTPSEPREVLDRHLSADRLWVWDDGGAVSMANASVPIAGISRIAFVYTPVELRGRGYATACVAALSQRMLDTEAEACMLYAQLQNPTSNSIYRRIGYRAVSDVMRYEFGSPD